MITAVPEQGASQTPDRLNPPYGGELLNLIVSPERASEVQWMSREWPSWDLTPRQICDLELLLNGGFSPLRGFMSRADYESTCTRMRLADGRIWPIPIILDVSDEFVRTIGPRSSVALRDPEGVMLAALHVEELWRPDRTGEANRFRSLTRRSPNAEAAAATPGVHSSALKRRGTADEDGTVSSSLRRSPLIFLRGGPRVCHVLDRSRFGSNSYESRRVSRGSPALRLHTAADSATTIQRRP